MSLKKFICLIMAVILVAAYGVIAVSAFDAIEIEPMRMCCDDYRGTATRILSFQKFGDGCESTVQTYCIECGTIFDTYTGIWIPCPHGH